MSAAPAIPLADRADVALGALARATGSAAIARLDGATLLGERAALGGFAIPGRHSAGGGCRLYDAVGGMVALNLGRPDDRDLTPALFEADDLDVADDAAIGARIARADARDLVARGRLMGLAIAAVDEPPMPMPAPALLTPPAHAPARAPRVLDLAALWAGPLAAHLLQLAGAEVAKVDSVTRPDAMREGDPAFFRLLNQHKASIALDLRSLAGRDVLLGLIAHADIVIEAARPRALRQLGIDAAALVRARPGLVWITITAHGAEDEAGDWVGFGDDVGVAAGLTAALCDAGGAPGFVGDAIADPLTGIAAAQTAWAAWASGRGGRYGIAMRGVVAEALTDARHDDAAGLTASLRAWAVQTGRPFPRVRAREAAPVPRLGADTRAIIAAWRGC